MIPMKFLLICASLLILFNIRDVTSIPTRPELEMTTAPPPIDDIELGMTAEKDYFAAFLCPLHDDIQKIYLKTVRDSESIRGSVDVLTRPYPKELRRMRLLSTFFGTYIYFTFTFACSIPLVLGPMLAPPKGVNEFRFRRIYGIVYAAAWALGLIILNILIHQMAPFKTFQAKYPQDSGDQWYTLKENRCAWVIDLRDDEGGSLKDVCLKLPQFSPDLSWSIAFRDNDSPVHTSILESDEFRVIDGNSPICEMARKRQVFVLKAEIPASHNWKKQKHLFQLTYELDKQARSFDSVKFKHGGKEHEFPPILISVSNTLKTFCDNHWGAIDLPEQEMEDDPEIIELLAKYWEAVTFTKDDQLTSKSSEFKVRMLQLIDYLMMERGLEKFLALCFAPSCRDAEERNRVLFMANSICGNQEIPLGLFKLWMKRD